MAEDRSLPTPVVISLATGAVLAVLFGALALVWRSGSAPRPSSPTLSEAQKAYLPQVVAFDARMSSARNFLGDTVYYLDGRVTNKGDKVVLGLELELKFVDLLNQVVLREKIHPLNDRTPPLKPGETRAFRVSFDRFPADWNRAPPSMTPTSVSF
jgi:hypothetical protein